MKKQIRKSGFGDYLAVDIIEEHNLTGINKILSTPLYLRKGKAEIIKGFDMEQKKWLRTEIIFDGSVIKALDIDQNSDCEGLEFEISEKELLNPKLYRF